MGDAWRSSSGSKLAETHVRYAVALSVPHLTLSLTVTAGPRDAEIVQGPVNSLDFSRAGVRHADTRSVFMNFSVDAGA